MYMKLNFFALLLTISFAICFLFFVNSVSNYLYPIKYYDLIKEACNDFDVEEALVLATIKSESDFDPTAYSSVGAIGLMQILPSTADYIASKIGYEKIIDLENVECNIYLGTAYISYLLDRFKNIDYVICAYNAGEGIVEDWIKESNGEKIDIEYYETKIYLDKVKYALNVYQKKLA